MTQLMQGMYADITCNLFNLRYNQQRTDEVIRNAGWFNAKGQKIGQGDLNLRDISNILNNIHANEIFFILSEGDSNWNIPSHLNRFEPGSKYCIEHCRWAVTGVHNLVRAFNVRDNLSVQEKILFDVPSNLEYHETSRENLYLYFDYHDDRICSIREPITVLSIDKGAWYGLDVYHLSDGKSWAVSYGSSAHTAASLKIKDSLWKIDLSYFATFGGLSQIEIDVIENLINTHKEKSNNLIKKIVGENINIVIEEYLQSINSKYILDPGYRNTYDLEALPRNHTAYRVNQNGTQTD